MAIVVNSNGTLDYFDTFAALAKYKEAHASDTITSNMDEESSEPSVVTLQLTNEDADTIVNVDSDVVVIDANQRKSAIYIEGNDGNNSIKGGTSADTLNGAKGNDTLIGGSGKDVFVYSGGDDVIVDYKTGKDGIAISNDTIISSEIAENDAIFSFANGGTLTVKDVVKKGKTQKLTITDDYGITSSQVYGTTVATIANADGDKVDLSGNSYVETVNATKRTTGVYIIGNSSNNLIKGGKGADTLDGGDESDNTLTGGGGADVFIYSGGDDVITDYNPNQKDVIKFVDLAFTSSSVVDNDVILEGEDNSLTIVNGKGKEITYIDSEGQTINKTFTDPTEYIFSKDFKGTSFSANTDNVKNSKSGIITIDASQLSNDIKIIANKNNNVIIGSKANDSLLGKAGNDTITTGKGNDTIVHEAGHDVITDYKSGEDIIEAYNSIEFVGASVSADSAKDVVLMFSNKSTVTVKNAIKINKGKKTAQKISIVTSYVKDGQFETETISACFGNDSIALNDKNENNFDATAGLNTSIVKINASKRKNAISIIGNDQGNIITSGKGADTIVAGNKGSTIAGGAGNDLISGSVEADSIIGGNGADTLNGGDGNDILNGGKGADVIYADAGNDTLTGGAGADTLYGGDGNDVFVYTKGDGNDVIADYQVGDIIRLGKKTAIKNSEIVGNDYVLTIGKGKLVVQGAADKDITIVNNKEEKNLYNTERSYAERNYNEIDSFWFTQDDVVTNNDLGSILKNDVDSAAISMTNTNFADYLNSIISDNFNNSLTKVTYSKQESK